MFILFSSGIKSATISEGLSFVSRVFHIAFILIICYYNLYKKYDNTCSCLSFTHLIMQKSLLHTYEVCKIGYMTGTCLRQTEFLSSNLRFINEDFVASFCGKKPLFFCSLLQTDRQ